MSELFTRPVMYWSGVNLVGATGDELDAFHRHYDKVHVPETTAANHFASGYRLTRMRQNPRRAFGPDYLSVYEIAEETAAQAYIDGGDLRDEERSGATAAPDGVADKVEPMWRIVWRQVADSGPVEPEPVRVRFIALGPAADATDDELIEWNDFYTEVHMLEAMERRGWTRATRWECEKAFLHPQPGCPRYFVMYESLSLTDRTDAEVASYGPFSEGPPIWKRNVGSWTLDFRIGSPEQT